jgi:hypothetical protein
MRLVLRESKIRRRLRFKAFAILAILILALVGAPFHHHESDADADGCCYCHATAPVPVFDLIGAIVVPSFTLVWSLTPDPVSCFVRIVDAIRIPRAPPLTTNPIMLLESCVGRV